MVGVGSLSDIIALKFYNQSSGKMVHSFYLSEHQSSHIFFLVGINNSAVCDAVRWLKAFIIIKILNNNNLKKMLMETGKGCTGTGPVQSPFTKNKTAMSFL